MADIRDLIDLLEDIENQPESGDILDFEFGDDVLVETRVVENRDGDLLLEMDFDALEYLGQQFTFEDAQWQGVAEGSGQLSIQQLATISDEALDKAYGYGRSTPGNSFGWQANLMSAAYAKKMIDAGVTDIEKISDAIHKGWNVTAQKFVQDPDQFGDTEKLRQAGKLEAKLQQRAKLMKINYAQLDNEEQEKDRVVARALLQAIKGQQGVAEDLSEAEYRGRKVSLGKPFLTPDGPKKRSVYVKNPKGNVVKVNFGQKGVKIKKNNPARRKSFRARHGCDNPGPRHKAKYWSCKFW